MNRFDTTAWAVTNFCACLTDLNFRIPRSRNLVASWDCSARLFSYCSVLWIASGISSRCASLSSTGKVVYSLKTPYRDGTTQVAFEPVDFIARLATLVPKPRVNLTRYHGVLAPNHRWRGLVTPARRGKGVKPISNVEVRPAAERHAAMTWAQRLRRVFNIDIEVCARCGGSVKVIACIEEQDVIDRVLAHMHAKEQNTPTLPHLAPPTRAPPETR